MLMVSFVPGRIALGKFPQYALGKRQRAPELFWALEKGKIFCSSWELNLDYPVI
jgi:hypothetical protein